MKITTRNFHCRLQSNYTTILTFVCCYIPIENEQSFLCIYMMKTNIVNVIERRQKLENQLPKILKHNESTHGIYDAVIQ